MILAQELATYREELPNLLKDSGKFALIHLHEVEGTYDTYEDALKVGYAKFKLEPFMIKKISASEDVLFFAKEVCPTYFPKFATRP